MQEQLSTIKDIAGRLTDPLDENQLTLLYRNMSLVRYNQHEIITKQGAFISHCTLVKSGLIKEYVDGNMEKTMVIRLGVSGNLLGLCDVFSQEHSLYNIAALTSTEVFLIKTECIKKLALQNPGFCRVLLEDFTASQAFLYQRLYSLGTKQMHGRLADIILYLTGSLFAGIDIFGCISRKDIADLCGMSTESVVRLLKEFRDDGLISYEGKEIRINNVELLERLSRIG